jgi:hypothetical protein
MKNRKYFSGTNVELLQKVIRGGNSQDDLENDEMDEVTPAKMLKKLIKSVISSNRR